MDFEPQKIIKLDEAVVNRIAAGEIIQGPSNCIKELLENSLDAKSKQIQITVKAGGLKSISINDNGTGIQKSDLAILCERFTTSKLKQYDDLLKIQSYGFRGEALASISMISRLTIQTKTRNEMVAYKTRYENGFMVEEPKTVAGNQGTTIIIDDLFYNVPIRQKKSPSEEFAKIFDVIAKYAVHNHTVSFCLKKHGENNSIKTQSSQSPVDIIRVIYGNEVANSLLKVETESDNLKFKMSGFISKADYSGKKGQFHLFINHRLVESKVIKKAIFDDLYRSLLSSQVHPFVYMSIEIDPANVDVNVSPTKNEVTFLNEDMIVDLIKAAVEEILLKTNETRRVFVQQLLPGASESFSDTSLRGDKNKPYAKDMIRTDAGTQSIVKFLSDPSCPNLSISFEKPKTTIEATKLTSISELRKEFEENCDENLKDQIRKLTYVGNADRCKSLIQCDNILYICDNVKLARELFYQESLRKFENFDRLEIEPPLPIHQLARIGFDRNECGWTEEDGCKEELSLQVQKLLTEQREMLQEYFQISINDAGEIESLPLIIENYSPLMAHLPLFLIRLATEVDFEHEKECFIGMCRELANFYSRWSLVGDEKSYNYLMEHVIFPKIQKHLYPPKQFSDDGTFLVLTKLQDLYKVFERC